MRPSLDDGISEMASLLKTRTPQSRDPHSMKARKGFRSLNVQPGKVALRREFARKR